MPHRSWIAGLLQYSQTRQKRRRSRIRTASAAEQLECRAMLTAALSLSVDQQPETSLSFTSSTNSGATGGVTSLDVSASDGWEFLTNATASSIQITAQRIGSPYNETHWTLNLSRLDGGNLVPRSYFDTSAAYYGTDNQASISFRSSNSYYTDFTGSFTIHELEADGNGVVRRFSADFTEQESNGTTTRGSLRVDPSPSVAENVGPTATQLTVSRDGDLSQKQIVQLTSGDTSLAQLPTEVTIAAGASSVTVPIDVIDNAFANGSRRVTFLATADPLRLATQSLVIRDDDGPPSLNAVILEDQILESAGKKAATLVLSRNTDPAVPLTVTLTSSDLSELSVPSTVVFHAGESSILVPLDAKDDVYLDGTQSVSITASADGMRVGSATMLVTDDPGDAPPGFTVTVDRSSVNESDGNNAAEITIRHNVDTTTAVGFDLISSVPNRLAPALASLAIPAGQREIKVKLHAIDDSTAFPNADVTITAQFSPYNSYYYNYPGQPLESGSVVVHVADNEIPAVAVSIDPLGSWLAFDSTPGSWVGQGLQNYYVSTNTGWKISASNGGNRYQSFSINEILPPVVYYGGNWTLDLAAPFGRTLVPGLFENAARYPFENSDQPGLTLSGNGRGNNRNSGFFTIVDASYGTDGKPVFFDVKFKQFDEENSNNWTEGEMLYRKVPDYNLSETMTREARTITVRRNTPTELPVTVSLQNLNPDDLEFPSSVVIPAGSASVTIPLIVKDNHAIDGNRTVTISSTAVGFVSGNSSAQLIDNDVANIIASESFTKLGSLTEGSEKKISVSLGAQPASNVVVKVDTGNAGRFTVDKKELIFTPENWAAQDIVVSATDNPFWDGNVTRSLSLSVVSEQSDPAFRAAPSLRTQFTVRDNEPAVPALSSPALTLAAHPLLQWNAVPEAKSYDLWIDNVTTGTRLYHRAMALTNSYRPEAAFEPGLYRVWIRVAMPSSVSPWSIAREFRVLPQPQLASTPGLAPAVGRVVWTPVDGISEYEVWINNLDTATRVYFETNLATPQTTVPLNLSRGSYAAFVRGLLGNVWTDWSDRLLFGVLEPPVTISSANVANGTLNVAWTAVPGATSYEILIHDDKGKLAIRRGKIVGTSYSSPVPSATVPLIPGRYTVDVRAWKGSQVLTAAGEGKTIFVVAAPKVSLTPTTIQWAAVAGASAYDIRLKKNGATVTEWLNYQSAKISLTSPLPPGQYVVEARSQYFGGTLSPYSVTNLELFRPAIMVSPFPESTVDATPVITWNSVVWAEKYSVEILKDGTSVPTFQAEVSGTAMLRISTPLRNGSYKVFVRGLATDGSQSERGEGQTLRIGGPVNGLTFRNGFLSWNAVVDATSYDLWINYNGVPEKSQIVREQNLLSTSYTLLATLPKGKYSVWVRAKRAEAGSVFESQWSQRLLLELV